VSLPCWRLVIIFVEEAQGGGRNRCFGFGAGRPHIIASSIIEISANFISRQQVVAKGPFGTNSRLGC
jgi:hypothetical protein